MTVESEAETYEQRFVAFVDILGFGDWVRRAHTDPRMRSEIAFSLRRAKEVAAPGGSSTTGLAFQFFSDSIIASAHKSVEGLWHLLLSMDSLAWNLFQRDVWVRGGVSVGGVFVDPEIIFGTGINDAYRLETTIAKSPRIILGREVIEQVAAFAGDESWAREYAISRIHRDIDGVYFLNFLNDVAAANGLRSKSTPGAETLSWIEVGRNVRDLLQTRVDSTIDAPEVYAKAKWMAEYWNRVVVRDRPDEEIFIGRVVLAGETPPPRALPHRASF